MARLEVAVARSVAPAPGTLPNDGPLLNQVDFRIRAAEGIDARVFVHFVFESKFSHVAAPRDLADYPASRDEALELLLGFYRQDAARIFVRIGETDGLIERVTRRLRVLLDAWAQTGPDPVETSFVVETL